MTVLCLVLCAVVSGILATVTGDGDNDGVRCGHPPVPTNTRLTLSDTTLAPGTTASYSCDLGYHFFGNEILRCSTKGRWEGDLPFCATNVALRRPANQSTTVRGGAAGNANDGDQSVVHDGRRCSETLKEASPWWQVDLLRPYPVSALKITSRGCCGQQPLQDLEIRVGNSSSELQRNPLCTWYPGPLEEGITKTFLCARTLIGQHVFIQLVGVEGSLSLCEVEVFSTDEFSNDRCAPAGVTQDTELVAFDRTCYEFNVGRGSSFQDARAECRRHGGDLAHGLHGVHSIFLLAELERRKSRLKTQLVWIGAQKEPSFTSHIWRWVNGVVVTKPAWGKDQPNNYNGEQNCVVLDGGRNWLWNDVGCNLDYLHYICQYSPLSCGSPDKQLNTTVEGTDHSVGHNISYHCPEGHRLLGTATRTCQATGFWDGTAPSCQYINCGPPGDLEHGSVTLTDNRTTYGAVVKFGCDMNYTLTGDDKRTCGDNGTWSGATPQCLFDWCPEPPRGEGVMVNISGKRVGSTATYSCQPGFILFGQQTVTCGPGGEWSGKAPSCKYIDCRTPAGVDNGHFRLLNGTTTHGSQVEYTCDQDYWLEPPGRHTLTCMSDANWSQDPPTCELITCGEPEVPEDGYVVGYDFNVHSTIEYHCEPGHLLIGQATLECNTQGEWSHDPPSCQFIDCGKVSPLPYGNINYINSTTHLDSELSYSCVRNYRLVGVTGRRCQSNKLWSDSTPRCEEIRCPEPKLAEHAILSVTNNDRMYGRTLIKTADSAISVATYRIGALVKYRCERGYKIVGDPLSTCEENGQWSGNMPQCVFVDCGMPTPLSHGHFSLVSNVTYYGAAVLYECDENYELDGYSRRICLENGTWSSETPMCKEIVCGDPETNEIVLVQTSTHSIGGVSHYTCPKGTTLQGNSTRFCLKTGQWSGKIPDCQYIDCQHPGSIENGRVIVVNQSTTYNSAVEYHCVDKYQRIGPYLRKCMDDGLWSGEEPRCEMITSAANESQSLGLAIAIGSGFVVFLLVILGLIYLRIRRETPVKNTENVEGVVRKEEQNAAVMSYATLNNGTNHHNNIYDNIRGHEELYDSPYEQTSHYEPSPPLKRSNTATVTINGVAVN